MPKAELYNSENVKTGEITLNDAIFASEANDSLVYESVKAQLANMRQGTAKAKNRSEVSGSGRKLWKQKGTGRARIGSIRSPIWKGGGSVFGPVPRDYSYSIPKKARRKALICALSEKAREGKIKVIEDLKFKEIKTSNFAALVLKLGLDNALFVIHGADRNLELSARNVQGFKLVKSDGLNIFDVMRHRNIVLTKSAAEKINVDLIKGLPGKK